LSPIEVSQTLVPLSLAVKALGLEPRTYGLKGVYAVMPKAHGSIASKHFTAIALLLQALQSVARILLELR
jgi:hypothetical protein